MSSGEGIKTFVHRQALSTIYKIICKQDIKPKAHLIEKYNCPACGSKETNRVSLTNYYCANCYVEFEYKTGRVYTIMYDGILVDHYINEFAEIN